MRAARLAAPRPRQRTPPRPGRAAARDRVARLRQGADKGAPPPTTPTPPPPPGPQHLACPGPPAGLHPVPSAPGQRRWVFPRPAPERDGDAARGPPASAALGGRLLSGPGPPSPESFPEASTANSLPAPGVARFAGDRSKSSGRSGSHGLGQRVPPPRTRPVGCPSRALLAGAQAGGAGPPHRWGSGCSAMLATPGPLGAAEGAPLAAPEEAGACGRGGGGARAGPTNPAPRRGSARRGCCCPGGRHPIAAPRSGRVRMLPRPVY